MNLNLATSLATNPADAIANSADWRTAVVDLINHMTQERQCFSSGELAAVLRTFRKDLRFSVVSLGEFVRDLYYSSGLPGYDDGTGAPVYPVQVARTTVGIGRTPAGQQVFVYAPDQMAGDSHDFEVDIPRPGVDGTDGISAPAPSTTPSVPTPSHYVAPATASPELPMASVAKDTRCYVPRKCVDAFLHASGRSFQHGDSLHVLVTAGEAVVTLDPQPGSQPYNLWASTGRIAFFPANGVTFRVGANYPVSVTKDSLRVNLAS